MSQENVEVVRAAYQAFVSMGLMVFSRDAAVSGVTRTTSAFA
jgi:hypothetical protein